MTTSNGGRLNAASPCNRWARLYTPACRGNQTARRRTTSRLSRCTTTRVLRVANLSTTTSNMVLLLETKAITQAYRLRNIARDSNSLLMCQYLSSLCFRPNCVSSLHSWANDSDCMLYIM